jgi:hypothetical protein
VPGSASFSVTNLPGHHGTIAEVTKTIRPGSTPGLGSNNPLPRSDGATKRPATSSFSYSENSNVSRAEALYLLSRRRL